MKDLFLDSNVLIYAYGGPSPFKEACRRIILWRSRRLARLHVSTEAIQELFHHRLRVADRATAAEDAREAMTFCEIHAFDTATLDYALTLGATTEVRGRDAVHAATALRVGFVEIISTDEDFDAIPGLRRVPPKDVQL
ncbi:MAG TPA: type II toxin-antitoxin system VapC family toxin [Jatrophihabitans sp.]|jgi:hypothetical protein